jgi:ferredoxin
MRLLPKRALGNLFDAAGSLLELVFGSGLNPLRHLGALTIFLLWIVLVSGIWLFIFFRTSIDGAYESVEYLTHQQWYLGGVMRSLHRYASDGAIVTLALHMLREWTLDRYRGKNWFSWITGVPMLWIIMPLGITGYWLVWDRLAQYVALTSAELLDWLPIFTSSMARNFLFGAALSDRFFTLMAFLHLIGLPLFLVFAIWLHVLRISRPGINPPRALMAGSMLAMLALSLANPAVSQGQADLATVPQNLGLDWYYLLVYPLTASWSPGAVWALLAGISLLLFLAPWLPPRRTPPVARVDLGNCNGCERCADDCPYGAIRMEPRSDGSRYELEAVVDPALCVSCGICVGSCPTATPFRKASALSPGIDLPDLSALALKSEIESAASGLAAGGRVLVFGCAGSSRLEHLSDNRTAVIQLRCAAHLPPSYIDFILSRDLADGVFFAGCADGGCRYRLGNAWAAARVARTRDPHLRRRVDQRQVALGWDERWQAGPGPAAALARFRQSLGVADAGAAAEPIATRYRRWLRRPAQALAWGLFALTAGAFAAWPAYQLITPGEALVSLSFSHAAQRIRECRQLTQEELEQLPPNMRNPTDCPRERLPLYIELRAGERLLFAQTLRPSGLWNDGPATVYARYPLPAGTHRLFVGMRDSPRVTGFDFAKEDEIVLEPGQHLVVDFDGGRQEFVFR